MSLSHSLPIRRMKHELKRSVYSHPRLVHLDLKGAPPKPAFLEQVFPIFRRWGATGLVIEYEDMFPYSNELDIVACPDAYSPMDIARIQELAMQNDLIVIPLIQTIGHLEFVLKHEKFSHLREVERYPNALCPLLEESKSLIISLIDQVMAMHPSSAGIHIGADEVWHVGCCHRCMTALDERRIGKDDLFLSFMKEILEYIHKKYLHVTPIMWDDMLRNIDCSTLIRSGIGSLVEPMVWHYLGNDFALPLDIWDKFSTVFHGFWVATAFKGATGSHQLLPNISHHIQNHQAWISVLDRVVPKFKIFRGVTLTGWQRYDHYAVLCELLPAGLPCLLFCLQTLLEGHFDSEVLAIASKFLGLQRCLDLNTFLSYEEVKQLQLPGNDVLSGVCLLLELRIKCTALKSSDIFQGWFTPYHVALKFGNPLLLEPSLNECIKLLQKFKELKLHMQDSLSVIYCKGTVEEWLSQNLEGHIQELGNVEQALTELINVGARPKSYHSK